MVILLASKGNNIGKSTTAHLLAERLSGKVQSFADPIREQVGLLYSSITSRDFPYTREGKNTYFEEPLLKDLTPRLLVNKYSDMVQELISPEVWAQIAYQGIDGLTIFDDWRRPIEYEYLKAKGVPMLTVYLDKQGVTEQVDTSYEGQLEGFDFDIRFTFTEDYSNTEELLEMVCLSV